MKEVKIKLEKTGQEVVVREDGILKGEKGEYGIVSLVLLDNGQIKISYNEQKIFFEISEENFYKAAKILPDSLVKNIRKEIQNKLEKERKGKEEKIQKLAEKAKKEGERQLLSFDIKMKNNCDIYTWKYVDENGKVEVIEKEMR